MTEQIQCWKATDGSLHATENDCKLHEKRALDSHRFNALIQLSEIYANRSGLRMDTHNFAAQFVKGYFDRIKVIMESEQ